MRKKWELFETNEETVENLQHEYGLNLLLAKILVNKGITEKEEIRKFLKPTRNNFYDPYLMPDMEKAVTRILKAIEEKEKVIIYGDYDVDRNNKHNGLKKFSRRKRHEGRLLYSK